MNQLVVSRLVAALLLTASCCSGARDDRHKLPTPPPRREGLSVSAPRAGSLFDLVELRVTLPRRLHALPDDQLHDAHDADRDGRYLRLRARFTHGSHGSVEVPGFAMREAAGGPWRWRVRWSPRRTGRWRVHVVLEASGERLEATAPPVDVGADPAIQGPLVAPSAGAPGYLRRLKADGSSEALWLFGACRAWVVNRGPGGPGGRAGTWAAHSGLHRERELLAPMRAAGFNLLNQWMAPWEYLLVHHDRAEHWRRPDGTWRRHPLRGPWRPHRAYDQGRALAFDRLLRSCERSPVIHQLLAPLPHQTLQMRAHPWGADESGWSPADDGGRQHPSKLNGFSGFRPRMTAWDFFEASPARPLGDWRSRLFDHQANFFRYLVARWGYSRALGLWVLVDELDAVGDALGDRARRRGWWAHPQCARWLADVVRLFRGRLKRADGYRYGGDPYRHPLHAATTSSDDRLDMAGNIGWPGGPADARPDLMGWHWYPELRVPPTDAAWTRSIDGLATYARGPGRARLVSEFGLPDRAAPGDAPSRYYPTLFHHAAWASLLAGHAGIAMDWDDGKEHGELRWRRRKGAFDRERYPIDKTRTVVALRRFLRGVSPEGLRPCGDRIKPSRGVRLLALCGKEVIVGWLFAPRAVARPRLDLPAGGTLTWYDPWSGDAISPPLKVTAAVPIKPALGRLKREGLSRRLAIARGQDVAFTFRAP